MGRAGETKMKKTTTVISACSTKVGGAQSLQTTNVKNLYKIPTNYLRLNQQSELFLMALEAASNQHLPLTCWLLSLKDDGFSFLLCLLDFR